MTDRLDDLKAALAGRYEIERELGAGGMATVYLARDIKHNREVAELLGHRAVPTTMLSTHVLNPGGLGVKSPADLLGDSGVGLPDEAAAGTVEAHWAAHSGNVPSVQCS